MRKWKLKQRERDIRIHRERKRESHTPTLLWLTDRWTNHLSPFSLLWLLIGGCWSEAFYPPLLLLLLLLLGLVVMLLLQAAGVAVTMISSPSHSHTLTHTHTHTHTQWRGEEREQTRRYHDAMASGWKTGAQWSPATEGNMVSAGSLSFYRRVDGWIRWMERRMDWWIYGWRNVWGWQQHL